MYSERGKRPLPELRPYPGQADVALRLVHLRRRRSAALVASAAGLVVVASLLVTARGSGLAVVEPAAPFPLPAASSPLVAVPAATPGVQDPSGAPRTVPGTTPAATVPAVEETVPPVRPGPEPSGRPPADGRRVPVRRHVMRKPTACPAPLGAWCASVIKTESKGVPWFQLLGCYTAGTGPGTLSFEYDREVDFAIVDSEGEEVWRWSSTEPEPAENLHALTAESGWCFVWTAVWDGRGDDGLPLAPGSYTLQAEVLSQPRLDDTTDFQQQ